MTSNSELIYFLSETHNFSAGLSVLNASFIGPMLDANLPIFLECEQGILSADAKCVILNFRDVPPKMESRFQAAFDQLMKKVRAKAIRIRIASVHPELRSMMIDKKLAFQDEFVNNMAEALMSLALIKKKSA